MQQWNQPTKQIEPTTGVVDIWRTSLGHSDTLVAEYKALLSQDESARAAKFRTRPKYREYVISRGLLRKVLGQVLGCNPAGIEFQYTIHNKPYLAGPSAQTNICFNVSHSHAQTLIALTAGYDIGIDIEHLRTNLDFKKMASRFFSRREAGDLDTYTDVGIPQAFFACWTRKEAFVKALGEGIAFGLSEFTVSVDPYQDEVTLHTHWDESFADGWSIRNISAGAEYAAALAVAGDIKHVRYWDL